MAWFRPRESQTDILRPNGLPTQLATLTRTAVMGVLNVTPDSFSDGGKFQSADVAIAHGLFMASNGADIIDVGGESTRPGAERISLDEEIARVIPVVEALVKSEVVVSIDTMRAEVARAAIEAGASLINDVSGGKADPEMFQYLAQIEVPYVLMHWRGHSTEMNSLTNYTNVVSDVRDEIDDQLFDVFHAGVESGRVAIDPGIGFAKTVDQNWPVLAHLEALEELGQPILIGASRKKFIGELLAENGIPRDVEGRESATTAITTLMAQRKVWAVRVHDVRTSRDAVEVVRRMKEAR